MRIREDGKHAHRSDTIKQAAEFWNCNKTKALMKSVDFSLRMDDRIREVLTREDLTSRQRREIAETLEIPGVYEIETQIFVEISPE